MKLYRKFSALLLVICVSLTFACTQISTQTLHSVSDSDPNLKDGQGYSFGFVHPETRSDSLIIHMREAFIKQLKAHTLPNEPIPYDQVETISTEIVSILDYIMAYVDREEQLKRRTEFYFVQTHPVNSLTFGLLSFEKWANEQGCIQNTGISGYGVDGLQAPVLNLTSPAQMPVHVDFAINDGSVYSKTLEVFLNRGAQIMEAPEPYVLPSP